MFPYKEMLSQLPNYALLFYARKDKEKPNICNLHLIISCKPTTSARRKLAWLNFCISRKK